MIWGIGGPFFMDSAINILFSRFKHFQLHVVDYPPAPRNGKFDSRSSTFDFTQEITFQLCVVDFQHPCPSEHQTTVFGQEKGNNNHSVIAALIPLNLDASPADLSTAHKADEISWFLVTEVC